MRIRSRDLVRPSSEGARLLVRSLLRDALRELGKLDAGAGGDALHDFRVSLRRLRSLTRAFRPSLTGIVRRKHERQLKAIAGATSEARDAEVQIEWLASERERMLPRDVVGVDWLVSRLEQARQTGRERAATRVPERFRRLAERLERTLAGARARRPVRAVDPPFYARLAGALREQTAELVSTLDAVTGPGDVEHAHIARIAAKRLRYLLEPLRAPRRPAAASAATLLKGLQDLLGEFHDAHVLGGVVASALIEAATDRARRAHAAILAGAVGGRMLRLASRDARTRGLLVLDRRVAERVNAAYSALCQEWLPAYREELAWAANATAEALSASSVGRSGPVRRFLLLRLPEGLPEAPDLELETGWLPGPSPRAWLARVNGPGGTRCSRGRGSTQQGHEISETQFAAQWPMTAGNRLVKHRRLMVREGQTWSIDVVGGGAPVLATVALPTGSKLTPPKLLRPVLVREVTGEEALEDEYIAAKQHRAANDRASGERRHRLVVLAARRAGADEPTAPSRGRPVSAP